MTARPLVVLLVLWAVTACNPTERSSPTEGQRAPIVNGQLESGWPAVGALVLDSAAYGYLGAFCTGTLVAPQWVLTAAHCLVDGVATQFPSSNIKFYVGTDASVGEGGPMDPGTLHPTDQFIVHPLFVDEGFDHDIALLHLTEPAVGIEPLVINAAYMDGAWVGTEVLYVGFGVLDGLSQGGGGVKRSTQLSIFATEPRRYLSKYDGSGFCFGDSGGPGIVEVDGQPRVVGVNESVGGDAGGDPCKDSYYCGRTDAYIPWLYPIMGLPLPDCAQSPEICFCPAACQPDGSCDPAACGTLACDGLAGCLDGCADAPGCQADCLDSATEDAVEALFDWQGCVSLSCATVADAPILFLGCELEHCASKIDACVPIAVGDLACDSAWECVQACAAGDEACPFSCYEAATVGAQGALEAVLACAAAQCDGLGSVPDCVAEHCGAELLACAPLANCAITGGDCGPGEACHPAFGVTDCLPSNGKAAGDACDVELTDPLDCGDGLICLPAGVSGVCTGLCAEEADCGLGGLCVTPLFPEDESIGFCVCEDADSDGACAPVDCDDGDAGVSPLEEELCDGADNDCDGDTDEDCPSPGDGWEGDVVEPPLDVVEPGSDALEPGPDTVEPGLDIPSPGPDSALAEDTPDSPGDDVASDDPVTDPASVGGCSRGAETPHPRSLLVVLLLGLLALRFVDFRRSGT